MSADNFIAVIHGKRHALDDAARYLLFVVGDSHYYNEFRGGKPSVEKMLEFCLENYAAEYWWEIPAEDTYDAAMSRCDEVEEARCVEYGVMVFE